MFFVLAWIAFLYLAVQAAKMATKETLYDPFEILNLPLVRRVQHHNECI